MMVKKDWFKDRGYLHLTNKINVSERFKIQSYISLPENVSKHRFSPLILRSTKSRRFKFSKELGKRTHKSIDDKGNLSSNVKVRNIMYATHIDSHVYSYYSKEVIQPLYEKDLQSNNI